MTLDLARIVQQMDEMVASIDPSRQAQRFDALDRAWLNLDDGDINARFSTAKTSFLLARSEAPYKDVHPLPPAPTEYVAVATDGSMILPSRHSPARFYVLNIGIVRLVYGAEPHATMEAHPQMFFNDPDLFIEANGRRIPVSDAVVGLRRAAAELSAAAAAIGDQPMPCVAFIDGSLILWTLMGQDETTTEEILREYLEALWWFKEHRIPIVSYISTPGSTDFMNTLRVSICDYPSRGMAVNCDHCRQQLIQSGRQPSCDILPSVTDAYLMEQVARLLPGERTGTFSSDSKILERYGRDLRIQFFYLNVGTEIPRVEMPAWLAEDAGAVDLVHAVVYEQCQLGKGYPVVLQEAHEMAVISMSDRQLIDHLIERRMAASGMTMLRTGKDSSKRGRFV